MNSPPLPPNATFATWLQQISRSVTSSAALSHSALETLIATNGASSSPSAMAASASPRSLGPFEYFKSLSQQSPSEVARGLAQLVYAFRDVMAPTSSEVEVDPTLISLTIKTLSLSLMGTLSGLSSTYTSTSPSQIENFDHLPYKNLCLLLGKYASTGVETGYGSSSAAPSAGARGLTVPYLQLCLAVFELAKFVATVSATATTTTVHSWLAETIPLPPKPPPLPTSTRTVVSFWHDIPSHRRLTRSFAISLLGRISSPSALFLTTEALGGGEKDPRVLKSGLEVSERSERVLMKTRILAMNPAKWLQT